MIYYSPLALLAYIIFRLGRKQKYRRLYLFGRSPSRISYIPLTHSLAVQTTNSFVIVRQLVYIFQRFVLRRRHVLAFCYSSGGFWRTTWGLSVSHNWFRERHVEPLLDDGLPDVEDD